MFAVVSLRSNRVVGTLLCILTLVSLEKAASAQVGDPMSSPDDPFIDTLQTVGLNFETDAEGNALDAVAIDAEAGAARLDIGNLYINQGISISARNQSDTADLTLGIFQSSCIPNNGNDSNTPVATSSAIGSPVVDGATGNVFCNSTGADGDPDLASGLGNNGTVDFNTVPQGNLLIIEENPGNDIPDDNGGGGFIRFDFLFEDEGGPLTSAQIGSFTVSDDANVTFTFTFVDGSTQVIQAVGNDENDLCEIGDSDGNDGTGDALELLDFSVNGETTPFIPRCLDAMGNQTADISSQDVDFLEINTNGSSAAFGGIVFSSFETVPFEMEAATGLSILGLGAAWKLRNKKRQ